MEHPVLEMTAIRKSFGNVTALEQAQFSLQRGEVHALLGVNGAGKSTLMKILSGVYSQDEGEITLNGSPLWLRSPKEAKEHGIYTVYQEVDTAIVAELSVAENILLDTFAGGSSFFISQKKLYDDARVHLCNYLPLLF